MKNLRLLSVVLFVSFTFMSFDKKEEISQPINTIEINIADLEFDQNGWSQWKTTSCFRYLKYQIKKAKNDNGEWFIKFKNNYNKNISMSIKVKGNVSGGTDDGRFTVRSGSEKAQYYFVSKSSNRISFDLNKVVFGKDNWSGPYAKCDS
jgi:hypothetical protein